MLIPVQGSSARPLAQMTEMEQQKIIDGLRQSILATPGDSKPSPSTEAEGVSPSASSRSMWCPPKSSEEPRMLQLQH
jgi:hypothetical protein